MRHWQRVAAIVAVGCMVTAACGDSGKKNNASSSNTTASSGSATTAASGGAATGEPITLGLTNMEGGAISLPEVRNGMEAAIAYVNAHGGVNGRPFKLLRCDVDGSP